jgi:hypothetical protein
MPRDLTPYVMTFRIDGQTFVQYVKEQTKKFLTLGGKLRPPDPPQKPSSQQPATRIQEAGIEPGEHNRKPTLR